MLLLALDTATPTGSVAVLRDGRLVGVVATAAEETYSTRLFRQLHFLLEELRLELRQFDSYGVSAGPGSFTGLRVGLAAVKAWAEVFEKPVVALSGLEAVAAQARAQAGELIAAVLDARRGQIYAGLYRQESQGLALEGEELVCTAEEFLKSLADRVARRSVRFTSPDPQALQPALLSANHLPSSICRKIEPASPVLAPILAELAFARAQRGAFTDALSLDANYIRRSDAELLWKGP